MLLFLSQYIPDFLIIFIYYYMLVDIQNERFRSALKYVKLFTLYFYDKKYFTIKQNNIMLITKSSIGI